MKKANKKQVNNQQVNNNGCQHVQLGGVAMMISSISSSVLIL